MEPIFKPKFFSLLQRGISKQTIQKDILAGIIVGIVALPLAIAFAVASGVSPEKGLITAVVAGFIISLLGGSKVQIGGPTGAFIVIVFGIVQQYGLGGLLISTVLAGILLVIFGVLRLGFVLKFIPHPLIVGFTSGIALIIFSTQIKDAFGMDIEKMPSDFISKWAVYFNNAQHFNIYAIGLTLATILLTVYITRIIKKIPGSFVAIIVITAITTIFKFPVSTIGSVFGEIPNNISLSIPEFDFSNIKMYFEPALVIALLGAIESLLSAVVADGMISGNHRSNTELIAQGIANIVTPFFGGIPATGAIARTATNVKNGGSTPISGMVHAITLLLIMLFFAKWAMLIPMSCLAGILIVVSYNMSEWRLFVSILRGSKYDILILLTTFLLTVIIDLTVAIEIGVVLSSLIFMQRMSNLSKIETANESEDNKEIKELLPKGIEVFEISGPFFFGAARKYQETLRKMRNNTSVIIIRMRHVPFIDATGLRNFQETVKELQKNGVKVILSGVRKEVYEELNKSRLAFKIGKGNIFDNFEQAVDRATRLVQSK